MTVEYQYQAFSKDGQESDGVIQAENENQARSQLAEKKLIVISLVEKSSSNKGLNRKINIGRKKLNANALAWMARNLATTQSSGLPIFSALGILSKQKANSSTGEILARVHKRVGDGASLGSAMREEEKYVGELTCAFIEAGEVSGKLEDSFSKLADITEARSKIKRKVLSAAMYPIVVLTIAILMAGGILIGVVPRFEEIYKNLGGELPFLTRMVIKLSDFAIAIWWLYPIIIFGFIFLVIWIRKTPSVLIKIHKFSLSLPLFGKLLKKAAFARLTSVLSSLLGSGVGLLESLEFAGKASGNLYIQSLFEKVYNEVKDGRSFSDALNFICADIAPDIMIQLVSIGEETGQLPELMDRYASTLDDEVATSVDGLTSLMEPLLIVVLGGIIGGLIFSFWLPMLNAPALIQNQ